VNSAFKLHLNVLNVTAFVSQPAVSATVAFLSQEHLNTWLYLYCILVLAAACTDPELLEDDDDDDDDGDVDDDQHRNKFFLSYNKHKNVCICHILFSILDATCNNMFQIRTSKAEVLASR